MVSCTGALNFLVTSLAMCHLVPVAHCVSKDIVFSRYSSEEQKLFITQGNPTNL